MEMIDVTKQGLETNASKETIDEANRENEWMEVAGRMAKKVKELKKKKNRPSGNSGGQTRLRTSAIQIAATRRV